MLQVYMQKQAVCLKRPCSTFKYVLLYAILCGTDSATIIDVKKSLQQTTCYEHCKNLPHCLSYYTTHVGVFPSKCKLAIHDGISNEYPFSVSPDFSNAVELNCSDRKTQTCFPFSKQCISCPERPTDWQKNVGPGYTVIVASTCCLAAHTDHTVHFRITEPMTLPFPNITIQGFLGLKHDYLFFNSSVCPMFNSTSTLSDMSGDFRNLNINCPSNQSNAAAIMVVKARQFKLTAANVTVNYARSAIMMVGGNHENGITPYSSVITTGTSFHNIKALPGSYPNAAAIALANTEGDHINISGFSSNQLIVVQPYLGDLGYANKLNVIDTSTPRIFNISAFTAVFGELYEIDFFNRNAGEINEYSEALKQMLLYQGYLFAGLLTMLIVVHQDIVYYVVVKSKERMAKTKTQ